MNKYKKQLKVEEASRDGRVKKKTNKNSKDNSRRCIPTRFLHSNPVLENIKCTDGILSAIIPTILVCLLFDLLQILVGFYVIVRPCPLGLYPKYTR